MWKRIKRFLLPPIFEDDPEKTQNAKLVHSFLMVIFILLILFPLVSAIFGQSVGSNITVLVWILTAATVTSVVFLQLGYTQVSGVILCLTMWAVFSFAAYNFGGLHDTVITGLFLVIVLSSLIGGWRVLSIFSGISIISLLVIYFLEQTLLIQPDVPFPSDASDVVIPVMMIIGIALIQTRFVNYLTSAYEDLQSSAVSLRETNIELENSQEELNQQTQELERRARYLEATAAIARDVTSELDPETLLRRVVILITDQFEFYHTGIFLIEPGGEFAELRATSSKGGQRMLEQDHKLRVGDEGIVGFVAKQGQSRVALDIGDDAVYFDNPELPETRSEVALPLQVRGQVIGVLDVQSAEPQAFDDEDVTVLQTLADQVAVALQTARLFQQVEENLKSQRQAYGKLSQEAWKQITRGQKEIGYRYIRGDVVSTKEQPISDHPELPEISLPIQISGHTIGHITAHKSKEQTAWASDEISVLENLTNQLSVALESARLYQETQQRAAREQLSSEVTTRIRETLDIETILKTASEEIRRALNLPEVVIRLGEPSSNPAGGATE